MKWVDNFQLTNDLLSMLHIFRVDNITTFLQRTLNVPTNRVTSILNLQRSVTANTALRLGKLFGTTPEFWLGLQNAYDLEKAKILNDLSDISPIAA